MARMFGSSHEKKFTYPLERIAPKMGSPFFFLEALSSASRSGLLVERGITNFGCSDGAAKLEVAPSSRSAASRLRFLGASSSSTSASSSSSASDSTTVGSSSSSSPSGDRSSSGSGTPLSGLGGRHSNFGWS